MSLSAMQSGASVHTLARLRSNLLPALDRRLTVTRSTDGATPRACNREG